MKHGKTHRRSRRDNSEERAEEQAGECTGQIEGSDKKEIVAMKEDNARHLHMRTCSSLYAPREQPTVALSNAPCKSRQRVTAGVCLQPLMSPNTFRIAYIVERLIRQMVRENIRR